MRVNEKGFTLLELVIAMTVLGLVTVALYGVVALGAAAAGAGERKTEQARRLRTAITVMARQLRSVAPMYVSTGKDEEPKPYFLADKESIEFVTAAPQGPYGVGLALVRYWLEDGKLLMSELPYFLAYDEDGLEKDADALKLETVLLYDVKQLSFAFQRSESDKDKEKWEDSWDASDDDALPAVVRIGVEPETASGPVLDYQIPCYVGVLNAVTGEDDFDAKRASAPHVSFATQAGQDGQRGQATQDKTARKGSSKGKPPPADTGDDGGDDGDEDLD